MSDSNANDDVQESDDQPRSVATQNDPADQGSSTRRVKYIRKAKQGNPDVDVSK